MPIQVFFVWLIGLVFIYFGYLVFSKRHLVYLIIFQS
ncbi:hypothetical protein X953_06660 [Virgibacillus sp. SK37]|nr:hypothetical protein X953_06660 [Virgibacillus sp. SK37]